METTGDQLKIFLTMFAVHLPTFLVCVVACVVIVGRWRQGCVYSPWAMAGFGLAVLLSFIVPAVQTGLQQWVFQSGDRIARAWVFTAFGFVVSVLHAAIYLFLLIAIFAGRTEKDGPIQRQ